MSRIANKPIQIPDGVKVSLSQEGVNVSGPKGELKFAMPKDVELKIDDGKVIVSRQDESGMMAGLVRSLVANMVYGVSTGWNKVLELTGTGYRANVEGTNLNLALGFSHPVVVPAPAGVTFEAKENKITIKGADKISVGQIAAKIRRLKPADPYKGKGFKYEGEIIIHKAGKAAKAGAPVAGK